MGTHTQLCASERPSAQKGLAICLTLCCHYPEILNFWIGGLHFNLTLDQFYRESLSLGMMAFFHASWCLLFPLKIHSVHGSWILSLKPSSGATILLLKNFLCFPIAHCFALNSSTSRAFKVPTWSVFSELLLIGLLLLPFNMSTILLGLPGCSLWALVCCKPSAPTAWVGCPGAWWRILPFFQQHQIPKSKVLIYSACCCVHSIQERTQHVVGT